MEGTENQSIPQRILKETKTLFRNTRNNLADIFDYTTLTICIWSLALTSLGYYTIDQCEKTRVAELVKTEEVITSCNSKKSYSAANRLSETALSQQQQVAKATTVMLEEAMLLEKQKKEVTTTASSQVVNIYKHNTSVLESKSATNDRIYTAVDDVKMYPVYTVPKPAKRVIVKAAVERTTEPINEVSKGAPVAANIKAKLAYAVQEEIEPIQLKAQESGKKIFLYFGADWCLPCKQMNKHTFPAAEVQQLLEQGYYFKKINVQSIAGYALQEYYGIKRLPTVLILDPQGEVMGKYPKAMNVSELTMVLERFISIPSNNTKNSIVTKNLDEDTEKLLYQIKLGLSMPRLRIK